MIVLRLSPGRPKRRWIPLFLVMMVATLAVAAVFFRQILPFSSPELQYFASVVEQQQPRHGPPPFRSRNNTQRVDRFPDRVQRVQLYMSNWYTPPCTPTIDVNSLKNGQQQQQFWQVARYQFRNDRNDEWPHIIVSEADTSVPTVSASKENVTDSALRVLTIHSIVTPDKTFLLDRGTILDCAAKKKVVYKSSNKHHHHDKHNQQKKKKHGRRLQKSKTKAAATTVTKYEHRVKFRTKMQMYCSDIAQSLIPTMDKIAHKQRKSSLDYPMLLQFGDLAHSHEYSFVRLPHLKKFRLAASRTELERVTGSECINGLRQSLLEGSDVQPIVWKLAIHRHFGLLDEVVEEDISWDRKRNMAVFRGQLTGSLGGGYNKHLSPEQNCRNLIRCRLVYDHNNSKLVDARLTSTRKRLPDVLNGVNLTTPSVSLKDLLAFKGIVMLEGNDVASGLKWALLSQSVVLMPMPRHTSWAMEELLEPWVHFVPLSDDAMDVQAKMQWVVDHDAEARQIATASTLWMQDLVFHPDAAKDDEWIQEEIVERYQRHFAPSSNTLSSSSS